MVISIIGSLLLFLVLALYVSLVFGAPLGYLAWGGKDEGVLPKEKRIQTMLSVPAQLFAIYVLLSLGGIFSEPSLIIRIFSYMFMVFFFINVILNFFSESKYEKFIMTPIAFMIALSFLYYILVPLFS